MSLLLQLPLGFKKFLLTCAGFCDLRHDLFDQVVNSEASHERLVAHLFIAYETLLESDMNIMGEVTLRMIRYSTRHLSQNEWPQAVVVLLYITFKHRGHIKFLKPFCYTFPTWVTSSFSLISTSLFEKSSSRTLVLTMFYVVMSSLAASRSIRSSLSLWSTSADNSICYFSKGSYYWEEDAPIELSWILIDFNCLSCYWSSDFSSWLNCSETNSSLRLLWGVDFLQHSTPLSLLKNPRPLVFSDRFYYLYESCDFFTIRLVDKVVWGFWWWCILLDLRLISKN